MLASHAGPCACSVTLHASGVGTATIPSGTTPCYDGVDWVCGDE
jgi:hypothetical protein